MDIKYKIEFHTDWHCGSGLAAGADVDALVVKDKNSLPLIPGKTIKGLLREAVEEIRGFQKKECDNLFVETFGYFEKEKSEMKKGNTFFSNAELSIQEQTAVISNKVARFMYRSVASTAIDKDGIAKEHSLRKMEVTVPCILYGEILNVPEGCTEEMKNALKYIKRLGQNRNRGLGRCTIIIEEGGKQ